MMTSEEILRWWLSGTTCKNVYTKRTILLENDTHILLKHGAHASYVGRVSGVVTCPAYACLYLKSIFAIDSLSITRGQGEIKQWGGEGGRLSLKKIRRDCEAFGVIFK